MIQRWRALSPLRRALAAFGVAAVLVDLRAAAMSVPGRRFVPLDASRHATWIGLACAIALLSLFAKRRNQSDDEKALEGEVGAERAPLLRRLGRLPLYLVGFFVLLVGAFYGLLIFASAPRAFIAGSLLPLAMAGVANSVPFAIAWFLFWLAAKD